MKLRNAKISTLTGLIGCRARRNCHGARRSPKENEADKASGPRKILALDEGRKGNLKHEQVRFESLDALTMNEKGFVKVQGP